jgi:hypothetical protein
MAEATYTKLRNDTWGIRVKGPAVPGDTVEVTTKAGETKKEVVERVLWEGDGVTICAVVRTESSSAGPRPRRAPCIVVEDGEAPSRPRRAPCACHDQNCCRPRCECEAQCVCRGGQVYDCMG